MTMVLILTTMAGLLGLAVGSFLNVVVYRVPAGLSVVRPRSACPGCGQEIAARDNIPIVSWLLLRGRCRSCRTGISPRYPLVELGGGLAVVGVALWSMPSISGAADASTVVAAVLQLVAYAYLAVVSIALALIDLDVHRLPNAIVLPGYAVGTVLLGAAALVGGDPVALGRLAAGAGILFAVYLALALVAPRGMGLGDVKLAGVLGLFLGYLGWGQLAVGAMAAFVLGGLFGVVLLALRRAGRTTGIPFGPWMLAGAWIGIVFGQQIVGGYLALVGLA
ncbi:prepilin peptidase [Pseudolysinimonas sp.]|uniref:prepilin peptidase n=1 Tax=Pseudolysinimonas sp. TaxID=2680009 RepID=UPI003F814A82